MAPAGGYRVVLIEDAQENYGVGNGDERFEKQEIPPEPENDTSTLRVLLREADAAAKQMMGEDELRAKIDAILPGATFEVDELGQIVIRTGFRVTSEAVSEILRQKARDQFPPTRRRFRRKK